MRSPGPPGGFRPPKDPADRLRRDAILRRSPPAVVRITHGTVRGLRWCSARRLGYARHMTQLVRRLLSTGIVATMLAAGTPTHALQLICRLPSAKDGSLLETLKIAVGAQGALSVW